MNRIAVSEFRANIMKILKKIEKGSSISITSRGKVVAKLIPPENTREEAKNKLKELGKNAILGDVTSPLESTWDAAQQ